MKKTKAILKNVRLLCLYVVAFIWNIPTMVKRSMFHKNTAFVTPSKRGLACMLAVTMMITALPFSGVIVKAENTAPGQDIVYNETDNTYEIYTAKGFSDFRDKVNGGDLSINARLMNEIDLSTVCGKDINGAKVSWTPIGPKYDTLEYGGTFDGNGYAITNLYINAYADDQSLF